METNIDCMKYRKSTHLASVDVEAIIAEKGSCELTIKLAFYNTKEVVNGKKLDGYFLEFEESGFKNMMLNSGNRKKIAEMVRESKNCTAVESRNLTNWVGLKINLKVDENVKFGDEVVGGIVIDTNYKKMPKKTLKEAIEAFDLVDSRESFVVTMRSYDEFMQNPAIANKCKELSVKFPKPIKND